MSKFVAVLAGMLVLSACATAGMGGEKHALSDLLLDDGAVSMPYAAAVGGLPPAKWYMKGLPLNRRVWVGKLSSKTRWMGAYDFDGDETLSFAEMTQAWLLKTVEWSIGTNVGPNALKSVSGGARRGLTGLRLVPEDERRIRAKIDALIDEGGDKGRLIKDTLEAVNDIAGKINPADRARNGFPFTSSFSAP